MTKPTKYTDVMKPEDISVGHCWTVFAGAIGLDGFSDTQRTEMRKAFYAGFSECFRITVDLSDTCTLPQATEVLSRLAQECNEFVDKMMKDYLLREEAKDCGCVGIHTCGKWREKEGAS